LRCALTGIQDKLFGILLVHRENPRVLIERRDLRVANEQVRAVPDRPRAFSTGRVHASACAKAIFKGLAAARKIERSPSSASRHLNSFFQQDITQTELRPLKVPPQLIVAKEIFPPKSVITSFARP
jgi:hypothetical protein